MTEPIITSRELRPLYQLLFQHRFWILAIFLITTLVTYSVLLVIKISRYEASAVVMIRLPVIDYEFRIDPNPQVAPAYLDLAEADALLYDTHVLAVKLHTLLKPLAEAYQLPEEVSVNERDRYLQRIRKDADFTRKILEQVQGALPITTTTHVPNAVTSTITSGNESQNTRIWQQELLMQPDFFLGLFELETETLEQIPLYNMQESFTVKTNIAQQTNISQVNQPFLNFKVRWDSPGSASVLANLWTRLFVDRANRLAAEMGLSTEGYMLNESAKIDREVEILKKRLADMQSQSEYQKMLEVQGLENALYGNRSQFDMYGYIELHADIAIQSGLIGELSRLEFQHALSPRSGTSEVDLHAPSIQKAREKIEQLKVKAQGLRTEVAAFTAQYKQVEFEINQRNRLLAERLTTAAFSSTRLKSGYLAPPVSFSERAVPSKHPTGPSRAILAIVMGVLAALLYTSWILYRGYLVPLGMRR